jgi:CubicO group peptidase (beta-lactamase class C family)
VLVAHRGEVIAESAAGLADRAATRGVSAGMRFGTASVTKMFTAAAVARLVDRGELAFDAPIHELLPSDWYPSGLDRGATVHHLLTHTANLPDYLPDVDPGRPDLWQAFGHAGMRRATDFLPILRRLPAQGRPGTTAAYCNAGYLVLGLVLEATAGAPFAETIEQEVFAACGMGQSAFQPFDEMGAETAIGYLAPDAANPAWRANSGLLPFAGAPDGGAFSTTRDILRFLVALHDGELLSTATRRAVLSRWASDAAGDTGFGYGQKIIERGGRTWFGHTGGDPGVGAQAWHSPEDGVSTIVLCNLTIGSAAAWRRLADSLGPVS